MAGTAAGGNWDAGGARDGQPGGRRHFGRVLAPALRRPDRLRGEGGTQHRARCARPSSASLHRARACPPADHLLRSVSQCCTLRKVFIVKSRRHPLLSPLDATQTPPHARPPPQAWHRHRLHSPSRRCPPPCCAGPPPRASHRPNARARRLADLGRLAFSPCWSAPFVQRNRATARRPGFWGE